MTRSNKSVSCLRLGLTRALCAAIKDKGLSQRQASKVTGLDQATISRLFTKTEARCSTERLIAALLSLGCPVHVYVAATDAQDGLPSPLEACKMAEDTFRAYADIHRTKGTGMGDAKAESNEALASQMRAAINGVTVVPIDGISVNEHEVNND